MSDIELVIKIPERIHYGIEKGITVNGSKASQILIDAVKNGTPLPKGHGDLKDQKDLAKSLYDYQWIDQLTYTEVTNRLINTPTIIEADKAESEPQESEETDG